jgi:diguanylate cyclase (GGDEF)-like protein/PAS domain S-box-containing protein
VFAGTRGPTRPIVARALSAAGAWSYLEMLATNLLDDPNVRGVVVNCRDITERIEAERALRDREERFRLLVQNAHDAIITIDLSGICTYASPSAKRVIGYVPDDLIGKQLADLVHPEDLDRLSAEVTRCIENDDGPIEVEYRSLHADGSWRIVETTFANLVDEPTMQAIVANVRDVTDLRAAQALLERLATHDSLTGLSNRKLFYTSGRQALERAASSHDTVALLYIDLDGFKPVNDDFGHRAGDRVLVSFAQRLRRGTRQSDLVARLGGDEFCVLCDVASVAEAQALAERLSSRLRGPIDVDAATVSIDISIGVAIATDAVDFETLVHQADAAMREAKRTGKGRVVVYEPREANAPSR